jgi:oligopeptide/dipeptide ABC transporter ATP-binding protein
MTSADPASIAPALLEVTGLTVEFDLGRRLPRLRAVDEVVLAVQPGETVGLVGESGSGKSTIGNAILGLVPVRSGRVSFDGVDITHAGYRTRRRLSSQLQAVFQNPYSSLNPTRTIGDTLGETVRVHGISRNETRERVGSMLERVGLSFDSATRFPTQFSGGQRQRVAIARALMMHPKLVICDEPVSALDLSVQAQVLNLLDELQAELGLSYLFVGHDLGVVRHVSHRIVVLYRGRVMEHGEASLVYSTPAHPYTQMLVEAAPVPDPSIQRARMERRATLTPSASAPVAGECCLFAPRCRYAEQVCRTERPSLEATSAGTLVACHRWREIRDNPTG